MPGNRGYNLKLRGTETDLPSKRVKPKLKKSKAPSSNLIVYKSKI